MPQTGAPASSAGFALALLTESFAVRALLGSVAAATLVALAVRFELVGSTRGRRLLVLAPVLAAAAAAVATTLESAAYLPQLLVLRTPATAGELRDLISALTKDRPVNLLLIAYAVVAGLLLARRLCGLLSLRRLVAAGRRPQQGDERFVAAVQGLAPLMGLPVPRLLVLAECPGGAFACGALRPMVAADPQLLATLDDGELEGLVAHELAHLRRRDPLLWLLVGAFRDLTFFLPTVHIAARWLRHEQEESADEVAARSTARPVALASSILKVWSQTSRRRGPRVACAAVPHGLRFATAGARLTAPTTSEGARLVTRRVERLLAGMRPENPYRHAAEIVLAGSVFAVALVAALTVPRWITEMTESDAVWVLSSGAAAVAGSTEGESPAFATFRSVTATPVAVPATAAGATMATDGVEDVGCPCIESQAQLREGTAARTPEPDLRLRWSQGSSDPTLPDLPRTHKLLEVDRLGSRVGVFLVESPRP